MTAEVDHIIEVHRASGRPGVVRDIATKYNAAGRMVHAATSWHYATVDPTTRRAVTPSSTGDCGTAVDFGGANGPLSGADSLALYRLFEPYGRAGQLVELFCAQSDWCVFRGKLKLWIDLPLTKAKLKALRDAHRNHVHAAVRPGVFLQPPVSPSKQEILMIAIEPVTAITNPSGAGGWVFGRQGHVYAFAGAPYFGGWTPGTAGPTNGSGRDCVALVPTATGQGYWLVSDAGEVFSYGDALYPGGYQWAWGGGVIVGAYRNDRMPTIGSVSLVRDDGINLNVYALPA